MRSLALAIAACLLATSGAARAGQQDHGRDMVRHLFQTADTDGNGTLTLAEYEAAGLARFGASFDQCDANADGETSLAEYLALYDLHHGGAGEA